jgi:hypothetical protein
MRLRRDICSSVGSFCAALVLGSSIALAQVARPTVQAPPPTGEPPAPGEWAALADLPDWTGVWVSDWLDQIRQEDLNDVPWNPETAAEIDRQIEFAEQGRPSGTHNSCMPWGMPGFMMLTHNAIEILFTPGRITILGELDGNNLRRIYTDGRPHPDSLDVDPSMHGHSIAHWEGETLVIDTVYIKPEAEIAISEGVGVQNGGDMHIVERVHLLSPNILAFDMEIDAPHILAETYKTRRMFYRRGWGPEWDIRESICVEGHFVDQVDDEGYAIFVPVHPDDQ